MSHIDRLLSMAARTGPRRPAAPTPVEVKRPCKGFRWTGQSFERCEECDYPAWDHHGIRVDGHVRPWKNGEAAMIKNRTQEQH